MCVYISFTTFNYFYVYYVCFYYVCLLISLEKGSYTNELYRCYRNLEILYYINYNMSKAGAILRYHVYLFLFDRTISKPTNTNLDGCLEVCIKTLNFNKRQNLIRYSCF